MVDVRLATVALLTLVGRHGALIRPTDEVDARLRQVGAHGRKQPCNVAIRAMEGRAVVVVGAAGRASGHGTRHRSGAARRREELVLGSRIAAQFVVPHLLFPQYTPRPSAQQRDLRPNGIIAVARFDYGNVAGLEARRRCRRTSDSRPSWPW